MSDMERPVRKAVFPAAGLGTRFLPATKAQPKEMLVLVDKPVIQYRCRGGGGVGHQQHRHRHRPRQERHRGSLRRGRRARERPRAARQEGTARGNSQITEAGSAWPPSARASRSASATPVLVAQNLVGDEPFAVVLGDDVMMPTPPALQQMIDVFDRVERSGAGGRARAGGRRSSYGIVAMENRRTLAPASTASPIWSRNRREKRRPPIWRSSAATSSRPTYSRARGDGERSDGRDSAHQRAARVC